LDDTIGFSGHKVPKVSIFNNQMDNTDSDSKYDIRKKVVSVQQKVREELLESSFTNLKITDSENKSNTYILV
jgi:hypothetical protein